MREPQIHGVLVSIVLEAFVNIMKQSNCGSAGFLCIRTVCKWANLNFSPSTFCIASINHSGAKQ